VRDEHVRLPPITRLRDLDRCWFGCRKLNRREPSIADPYAAETLIAEPAVIWPHRLSGLYGNAATRRRVRIRFTNPYRPLAKHHRALRSLRWAG
jgi:hypothetical protein